MEKDHLMAILTTRGLCALKFQIIFFNVLDFVDVLFVCLMVINATFNNISVISWQSVLLVEETGENHRPVKSH